MVLRIPYPKEAYLNHGKYKPCADCTIGAIIEYLEQFPPEWRINVGYELKSEPVLIDGGTMTIFTEIGDDNTNW
jgi:hypothetical protein